MFGVSGGRRVDIFLTQKCLINIFILGIANKTKDGEVSVRIPSNVNFRIRVKSRGVASGWTGWTMSKGSEDPGGGGGGQPK